MNKHYTIMIIPEKSKEVRSFRLPRLLFNSFALVFILTSVLFGIFLFDYWKVLQQIHENKHLSVENRQLRDQIQIFQMKVNSLDDNLERISIFEKKLRVITGLEEADMTKSLVPNAESSIEEKKKNSPAKLEVDTTEIGPNFKDKPEFKELKRLYDKKIARKLGIINTYKISEKLSSSIKKSLNLSDQYASFDYKYRRTKKRATNLEESIDSLDRYLLNKESILRSTPMILPTKGWVTSYFGQRISPTLGVPRMHEGLDMGAPYGTPIKATADGIVTYSGKKSGFGLFVQIDHGYGIETIYAHSQKIFTKSGQRVKRGDLIASVGSTGRSTGPHLHYEVRVNGIAVDPLYFVLN